MHFMKKASFEDDSLLGYCAVKMADVSDVFTATIRATRPHAQYSRRL
jgi:hypothetical protein